MTHSSEMRVPPQKLLPSMVTATCLYLFWSNVIISSPNLNNEMQIYQGNSWGTASTPPTMRLESTLAWPQKPVNNQIIM
jgi:hypothetical protein